MTYPRRTVRLLLPGLLLLVALSKLLAFTILTPMWQAPDEAAHSAAIAAWIFDDDHRYRDVHGRTPVIFEEANDWGSRSRNLLQLKGNVGRGTGRPDYEAGTWGKGEGPLHEPIPVGERLVKSSFSTFTYPQLYYWLTAKLTGLILPESARSLLNTLFTARLIGAIWVVMATLGLYGIGLCLTDSPEFAFILTLVYICNGLFTFLTAVLNADGPLFALFILGSLFCTRLWIRQRLHPVEWAGLALVALAAPLIKPSGLFFAIFCIGLFSPAWWFRRSCTARKRHAAALFVIMLSAGGVHLLHTALKGEIKLHADPAPLEITTPWEYLQAIYTPHGQYLTKNLIGQYGWFGIDHAAWMYVVIYGMLLAGSVLFLWHGARRSGVWTPSQKGAALLLGGSFLLTVLGVFVYHYYVIMPKMGFMIQGRYFSYGFFSLYCVATLGLFRGSGRWYGKLALMAFLTIQVALPFDAAWRIVARFYAPHNWTQFVGRLSQYKPVWLKGNALVIALTAAELTLLIAWGVAVWLLWRHRPGDSHSEITGKPPLDQDKNRKRTMAVK